MGMPESKTGHMDASGGPNEKWLFLKEPDEREYLKEAGMKLARTAIDKGVETLISGGFSGSLAAFFIKMIVKNNRPGTEVKIYSAGDSLEYTRSLVRGEGAGVVFGVDSNRVLAERREFQNRIPGLAERLKKPIMIVDETLSKDDMLIALENTITLIAELEGLKDAKVYKAALFANQPMLYGPMGRRNLFIGKDLPPQLGQEAFPSWNRIKEVSLTVDDDVGIKMAQERLQELNSDLKRLAAEIRL